ncbi:hypothetical protein GCM10010304_81270 [Streptomyces roseoviolaceus]
MTPSHRVTSDDGTPVDGAEDSGTHSRNHSHGLRWAQLLLSALGAAGAITIWALEGPPLVAAAVATAAAGSAGWQITVTVKR